MRLLKKQKVGTLGAYCWDKGISFGIHGKGNFASFEYNDETDELLLLIRDKTMREQHVKIKFVDDDWN